MGYIVNSKAAAWKKAGELFPTDYAKDDQASDRAGYPIYWSTAAGVNAWISDLNARLEVNLPDGKSVNIWIEEPKYKEYQIKDAIEVLDDAIYHIEDMIDRRLAEETGIEDARVLMNKAYNKLARILADVNPKSKLFDTHCLDV